MRKKRTKRLARQQRGAAMLLVLFAVSVATILGLSFLNAQSTTVVISRNVEQQARVRGIAETAMMMVAQRIRLNENWRTEYANGSWVTDQSVDGGLVSISVVDGGNEIATDGDLSDDPDDPATITVTARYKGVTHTLKSVILPKGRQYRVLMVVPDVEELSAGEVARKADFRDWAWSVATISQSASETEFSLAIDEADVVYVCRRVRADRLGSVLNSAKCGIVTEQAHVGVELGMAGVVREVDGRSMLITDNSHHITREFGGSYVRIFSGRQASINVIQQMTTPDHWSETKKKQYEERWAGFNTMAPGASALATRYPNRNPTLAVISKGDELVVGTSPGKRVFLPWGGQGRFRYDELTHSARTILRRSLEWAGDLLPEEQVVLPVSASVERIRLNSSAAMLPFNSTGAMTNESADTPTNADSYNHYRSVWERNQGEPTAVATNSTTRRHVSLGGYSHLLSNVYVGPGGQPDRVISVSRFSRLTGITAAQEKPYEFTPVRVLPTGDKLGDYVQRTGTECIADSRYYGRVTLYGNSIIEIEGDVTIYCEQFEMRGDTIVNVLPDSTLTIYAERYLQIRDNAKLNVTQLDPSQCRVICGRHTYVKGFAVAFAEFVNPVGYLIVRDRAQLFGTFEVRNFYASGRSSFYLDTKNAVNNEVPQRQVYVLQWNEHP